MAGGFTRDGAVQDQIDASVDDAVAQVRARLPAGEGLTECEVCGEPIPPKRIEAIPGVRLCVACQQEVDARQKINVGYNRRGSKGSQLK